MEAVYQSDCGKVRPLNEDFCFVKRFGSDLLAAVADGMGGYSGGEVASRMAVDAVVALFEAEQERLKGKREIVACLKRAMKAANEAIYSRSLHNSALGGMGTTLVLVYIRKDIAYFANVGDSRAYVVTDGEIRQITQDHSLVSDLVRNGTITAAQARVHPQKNIITRAVGTERDIKADYFAIQLEPDDIIVLCTDGLSNLVEDYEIAEMVSTDIPLQEQAQELVNLANEKDGYDNISVVLIR